MISKNEEKTKFQNKKFENCDTKFFGKNKQ